MPVKGAARVYSGGDLSVTYDAGLAGGESLRATLKTPSGQKIRLDTTITAPNVRVSLDQKYMPSSEPGLGRVEVVNEDAGVVVVWARLRMIGSIRDDHIAHTDAYWYT